MKTIVYLFLLTCLNPLDVSTAFAQANGTVVMIFNRAEDVVNAERQGKRSTNKAELTENDRDFIRFYENIRTQIERDLRKMVQDAYEQKTIKTPLHSIEPYFDGRLGTAKLQKARTHFNNAQRDLSESEFDCITDLG